MRCVHRPLLESQLFVQNLVRYQTEDAGLLLLAPHPEANHWELMYMGLAPTWRGYGLGKQVVNEALRKAKEAGMKEVILSVDQRNTPAKRLYQNHGFETRTTCTVHAWISEKSATPSFPSGVIGKPV